MKKALIIGGLASIAIIAISVFASITLEKNSENKDNNSTDSTLTLSSLITKDTPVKGDISAPITIIEFGDFQCPNCGRFARDTSPQIEETYVKSGQVSMAFKQFAVIGPDSRIAAMASQCANDQGKFWEFHDELYNNQGSVNSGWVKKDNLKKVASTINLDQQSFDSCLDSNKYQSLVENDLNIAKKFNFRGTPSFLIFTNDGSEPQALTGAYPYEIFEKIIEEKIN